MKPTLVKAKADLVQAMANLYKTAKESEANMRLGYVTPDECYTPEELMQDLMEFKDEVEKSIDEMRYEVIKLDEHECRYNDGDYCYTCGKDGRA